MGYGYGTADPDTGIPVDLWSSSPQAIEKKMRPVPQDMLEHYGYDTMADMYESLSPGGYIDMTVYNRGSRPEELQTLDANLQSYEFKNLFRCIMAESDEEFERLQDEYIAGLSAFNIDEIYNYWLSVAKEQQEELKPIIDEVSAILIE